MIVRSVALGAAAVMAVWRAASAAAEPSQDGGYPSADRAGEENRVAGCVDSPSVHLSSWSKDDQTGGETSQAYLNGRTYSIAGGTNEMQRNGISERVLGMPREPSYDTKVPFAEVVRNAGAWRTSS